MTADGREKTRFVSFSACMGIGHRSIAAALVRYRYITAFYFPLPSLLSESCSGGVAAYSIPSCLLLATLL